MKYFLTNALLAAALSLWLATSALAGFNEGLAAYNRGDYATALEEWLPVAERGGASAQFNLALMYKHGDGVPQDSAEAVKWYRLAAEQGVVSAQSMIGISYISGIYGVAQDDAEALKWLRLAAEQGEAAAQGFLGGMYLLGSGEPRDYIQAHMWFNLAAAKGNEHGRKYRNEIEKTMTLTDISNAERLAREWLEKHGE